MWREIDETKKELTIKEKQLWMRCVWHDLFNLIASWLVFDATINILGKYFWCTAMAMPHSLAHTNVLCLNLCQAVLVIWRFVAKKRHEESEIVLHCFRASVIVSIVCPKVTHWWSRLFIKLNSLCRFFISMLLFFPLFDSIWLDRGLMWFPMCACMWFVRVANEQKTERKTFSLINFNTNLVMWFDLICIWCLLDVYVCVAYNRFDFMTILIIALSILRTG